MPAAPVRGKVRLMNTASSPPTPVLSPVSTLLSACVTHAMLPLAWTVMPIGLAGTVMVRTTRSARVSITETEALPVLVTYMRLLFGWRATPVGFTPTGIVSITALSSRRITDTVPSAELGTKARYEAVAVAEVAGSTTISIQARPSQEHGSVPVFT
jgi:hypothetical protein